MNALKSVTENRLKAVRDASRVLRTLSTETKNRVLLSAAAKLATEQKAILKANLGDLKALPKIASEAFRDRLTVNEARLDQMAESLRAVAALPDPVGETVEQKTLKNGLRARRVRSPLGVILMIFESRPNVALEAFSLAFKAGNAVILRGGKESMKTTAILYRVLETALKEAGVPRDVVWGVTDPDRGLVKKLLSANDSIDVVVPRGGEGLIDFVTKNTRIPIIKNDRGMCHVYVHEDADLEIAGRIVLNAKTQRPGVCNAMETLLVHESVAREFLPRLHALLAPFETEWRVCPRGSALLKKNSGVKKATGRDWDTEHLALRINCRVVDSLEDAIAHIERHGSRHSEAIITKSAEAARRFQSDVDAAAVYWNASTRFTDGFELGLGGELGISTQKLHVRGPVGLRELTSVRWIIEGEGQVRT